MAKIYAAPKEFKEPEFTHPFNVKEYEKDCERYIKQVQEWAKAHGTSELRGDIISFGVADGTAQYVVYSLKPVQLIHLRIGDAYQFQYAHLLTAKAVRDEVRQAKAIEKIFSKKV